MTQTVKDILSRFLFRVKSFLIFWWRANTIYRVHSPLATGFIREVLEDRRQFYAFPEIEWLRRQLLDDRSVHVHADFGTGRSGPVAWRRIVRRAASTPAGGAFLFRLALWRKPACILEIGTSVGMGAMYLASADRRARLIGLEGCPDCCRLAGRHFQRLGLANASVSCGPFGDTLPEALSALGQVDLAHIDGNHDGMATLDYFNQLLAHAHSQTLLVFDDIYWSADMQRAWEQITAHPSVRLSIDCYHAGLVLLDPGVREKQHFIVVPRWWKPFQLY